MGKLTCTGPVFSASWRTLAGVVDRARPSIETNDDIRERSPAPITTLCINNNYIMHIHFMPFTHVSKYIMYKYSIIENIPLLKIFHH